MKNDPYINYKRMCMRKEWRTLHGEWLKHKEMGDRHLRNTANLLLRNLNSGKYDREASKYIGMIIGHINQELLKRRTLEDKFLIAKMFGDRK